MEGGGGRVDEVGDEKLFDLQLCRTDGAVSLLY